MRTAHIQRKTAETDICLDLNLDGTGVSNIDTGCGFLNHMLTLFAKHGLFDLEVKAVGDLEIDAHHTMEDLGLTLGEALLNAVGDKKGINRYGHFTLPMDETLAQVALDLSGRPYLVYKPGEPKDYIKDLDTALFREFFVALSNKCQMNLHIHILESGETHHIFEAIFKCFARALSMAVTVNPRVKGVPSTKGSL